MDVLSFALDRDDLCDRLGGGIPRGSLVVVEGAHGAGKSILSQRLAMGLVMNGHTVSLVSTELTTSGFMSQMGSLNYDVEKPLLGERLVFVPVYPMMGTRAPPQDLLPRVLKAQRMFTKDVILFDAFSKFLNDHERATGDLVATVEQVEAVLYHFKKLTSAGKTIIVNLETGQCREELANLFKDSADTLLSLKFELLGNTAARRIIVQRMSRAAGRFGDVIGYRVEPGVGIVIEIRSVV